MEGIVYAFQNAYPYTITFKKEKSIKHLEGYSLVSEENGIAIRYSTDAGAYYAAQTLYQLLAYSYSGVNVLAFNQEPAEEGAPTKKYFPLLTIEDSPAYAVRSVMIDMGRAPFSIPLIKRVIRIMAHLKLNTLHLHLFDDQLMGFKFKNLPLGSENPAAITAGQLKEIVSYARSYHVSVMPEIESWGHVASIIYHYPKLLGAPGMYGGSSFAIGEKTFDLLGKIYDEIIPCLEETTAIHVGLDEAVWTLAPGEENKGLTPTVMVKRIYDILMTLGAKHKKQIIMHLWADHGGRPLPKEIGKKVVIEPWKYRQTDEPKIIAALQQYGGKDKTPLMMGAGASSVHYNGTYEATRFWCREGLKYPNVLGVTICIWETNDIAGKLITMYGGACAAWSPNTLERTDDDPIGERARNMADREMRKWQIIFPDANPDQINADRGPEAYQGRYVWPPRAGVPVAPTALPTPQ